MYIAKVLSDVKGLDEARKAHLVAAFEAGTLTDQEKTELKRYVAQAYARQELVLEALKDAQSNIRR